MPLNFKALGLRIFFVICLTACLMPSMSSAMALFGGIGFALFFSNPFEDLTRKVTSRLLALSVVGLGAGMDLFQVFQVGAAGIGYTIIGIGLTLVAGVALGKILRISRDTSFLITIGTAICGGSAIAAAAPALNARHHDISVALAVVFSLNALALLLFPSIGEALAMTQHQFGLWSALTIHDTSSVVGATMQYGTEALEIGTTVKLARALWIIPLTMALGIYIGQQRKKSDDTAGPSPQMKYPWFILGFALMAALMTWVPSLQPIGHMIETTARRLLIVTLFLIGAGLSRDAFKSVGLRPFLQGFILWLLVASSGLAAILLGWIS